MALEQELASENVLIRLKNYRERNKCVLSVIVLVSSENQQVSGIAENVVLASLATLIHSTNKLKNPTQHKLPWLNTNVSNVEKLSRQKS